MKVRHLRLNGLLLLEPKIFGDGRGFFFESYNKKRFTAAGVPCDFVQDNHSRSAKDVVRGLHYQTQPGQAKLVRVLRGRIWDVVVDIRPQSKTFGEWESVELDDQTHQQLFVPIGFAHGFCVLSDAAEVAYKVSALYDGDTEATIKWDDADIAVQWPTDSPLLSERDQQGESWKSFVERASWPGPTQ